MSNLTLVNNAFANVCRGGANALVLLLLPMFLTESLQKESYSTWLLVLQLSTYVSLLDFGIQTTVGRYIAHCNELGDNQKRDSIVNNAIVILAALGVLAVIGIVIVSSQLPYIFKDIPKSLQEEAQSALILVGISIAITLPFSVFSGIFIGLQRYDVPAWIMGISKLLGAISVVLVAKSSHSITMMALATGLANLCTGVWQFIAYKRMAGYITLSSDFLSKSVALEVITYCSAFIVWSMGMTLVSGLDTVIIGFFDYKSLVYYSLAATLTSFVSGLQSSIFSTILPVAAATGAKKNAESLGDLLLLVTRYSTITLIITSLPVILYSKYILAFWVGETYASYTSQLLQIAIIANFIRQIGSPYAMIAVAIGEQNKIILSPLMEGVVNITVSIFLVSKIGVLGVVIGTAVGGIVSTAAHLFYNLPRTKGIFVKDIKRLLVLGITNPLMALLPTAIYFSLLFFQVNITQTSDVTISALILLSVLCIIYFFVIDDKERKYAYSAIARKFKVKNV
jgi:O-antigen/teichoic acid export membrane protein